LASNSYEASYNYVNTVSSVADPDPGSGASTPGSGMGKKSKSGKNIPDHVFERLETIFLG
jgi:hypothetical protein